MPDSSSADPTHLPSESGPPPAPHPRQGRGEGRERLELLGRAGAGLAHDFNNLLAAITGHLQVALEEDPSERVRHHLDAALEAAWGGAAVSRLVLDLAHPGGEEPRPVAVAEVLPDLERVVRLGLGSRVTLRTEERAPGRWLVVDPVGLVAAVLVLALWVGEDAPPGTRLVLRIEEAGEDAPVAEGAALSLGIAVVCTGRGAGPARAVAAPVGLGRALALAASRGGRVETADSDDGRAWARIVLPAWRSEEEAAASGDRSDFGAQERTVLLVEDDQAVARALSRVLVQLELRPRVVSSAEEALALVEEEPVALVVTDQVVAGDLSGLDLVARLRSRRPDLPLLLCTGLDDIELPCGAADVPRLQKPFGASAFRAAVLELLTPPPGGGSPA